MKNFNLIYEAIMRQLNSKLYNNRYLKSQIKVTDKIFNTIKNSGCNTFKIVLPDGRLTDEYDIVADYENLSEKTDIIFKNSTNNNTVPFYISLKKSAYPFYQIGGKEDFYNVDDNNALHNSLLDSDFYKQKFSKIYSLFNRANQLTGTNNEYDFIKLRDQLNNIATKNGLSNFHRIMFSFPITNEIENLSRAKFGNALKDGNFVDIVIYGTDIDFNVENIENDCAIIKFTENENVKLEWNPEKYDNIENKFGYKLVFMVDDGDHSHIAEYENKKIINCRVGIFLNTTAENTNISEEKLNNAINSTSAIELLNSLY